VNAHIRVCLDAFLAEKEGKVYKNVYIELIKEEKAWKVQRVSFFSAAGFL